MTAKSKNRRSGIGLIALGALLWAFAGSLTAFAADTQDTFPTPEKAVDALVFANQHDHTTELKKILGPGSDKLIHSGDDVADENMRARFVTAYEKAHKLETGSDGTVTLVVGEEDWPMPIPLVQQGGKGWRFDTKAGEQEILNRRIGRNELNVIEVCRAYVEAQHEFAGSHALDKKTHEFAQTFQSTQGQHDGLYWQVAEGEPESPLGPLIAEASAHGYTDIKALSPHEPYHGYYYKILTSQGAHAAGGALDYMDNGHMSRGFALVAFPAIYGDSGVMTFIVNQNGIVYEKNFGPDTASAAMQMTAYDPDESWTIVK